MSILKSVIEEELSRNMKNQEMYRNMLKTLHKGTIQIMTRNDKKYVYLKYREGNKVIKKYICSYNNKEKFEEISNQVNEYHRIKSNLRITSEEELNLRKALKVYGK